MKYSLIILLSPLLLLSQEILVQPYLQNASSSSIVIMWELDQVENGHVEWGLSEILGKHYSLECEKIDREKSVGHLVKAAIDMGAEAVDQQSMKAILEGEDGKSE